MKRIYLSLLMVLLILGGQTFSSSQGFVGLLEELFNVPSPTGYEGSMVSKILKSIPEGYETFRDNLGSLYCRIGEGKADVALLAGMDEHGYYVSGIQDDGYLTLDRVSGKHSLYDLYNIGHPVFIWTELGKRQGVLSLPSLHLASSETRRNLTGILSLNNAVVDIGAKNPEDVKTRGVKKLDAVTPWPEWTPLAQDKIAGHGIGLKSGIAALAHIANELNGADLSSGITLGWLAQTKFLRRRARKMAAMGAARASAKLEVSRFVVIDTVMIDGADSSLVLGRGPVLLRGQDRGSTGFLEDRIISSAAEFNLPLQRINGLDSGLLNPFLSEGREVVGLFLPVKFKDTPGEVVDLRDVQVLIKLLSSAFLNGGGE
ncbi:hypothetical protein ACFLT9_06800 [Acidobacteriota bacterium]